MIIVFGGAYQGKLDFVLSTFNLQQSEVCNLENETMINTDKKVIYGIEHYVYECIEKNANPIQYFENNLDIFRDKILICTDISCGIVPLTAKDRLFRDNTGKVMQILCRNAESVYRVFCGIGEKIK